MSKRNEEERFEVLKAMNLLAKLCNDEGFYYNHWIYIIPDGADDDELLDIEHVLTAYGLPVHISGYDAKEILETTKSDKKMVGGKVKFTLLKRIGEAYSDLSLTDEDLLEAIHYVLSE